MLRTLTGLNAQQHIHQKLIEKAKEPLVRGKLTVAEIAYQLGLSIRRHSASSFEEKQN